MTKPSDLTFWLAFSFLGQLRLTTVFLLCKTNPQAHFAENRGYPHSPSYQGRVRYLRSPYGDLCHICLKFVVVHSSRLWHAKILMPCCHDMRSSSGLRNPLLPLLSLVGLTAVFHYYVIPQLGPTLWVQTKGLVEPRQDCGLERLRRSRNVHLQTCFNFSYSRLNALLRPGHALVGTLIAPS